MQTKKIFEKNNISKSKTWRITDYDTSERRIQFYKDLEKGRLAVGKEVCPTSGREHLQVFITFKRTYAFPGLKKILGDKVHIEAGKVLDWNYELKEMNYIIEDNSKQGKRNDLSKIKTMCDEGKGIRDIIDEVNYQGVRHAELYLKYKEKKRYFKPKVYWIYGATGVGKSKFVYDKHGDDVFAPINFKWWEGYDAHKVVIIDDYRRDFCKFHELLKLLDRYPYRVETKGGSRQLLAEYIYITTPHSIDETFGNRCDEDINQLKRRVEEEICLRKVTEVKEGNTSSLTSEEEYREI